MQGSDHVIGLKTELTRLVGEWADSMSLTIMDMTVYFGNSGRFGEAFYCHATIRAVDRDLDEVFYARLFTEWEREPTLRVQLWGFKMRIRNEVELGLALEAKENYNPYAGDMIYGD